MQQIMSPSIIRNRMGPQPVKYVLGVLSGIQAEGFGQPGQRTFRLALQAGEARCVVWLEKEQLFRLGTYLQDMVHSLSEEERHRPSQPGEPEWSGSSADLDFKAGQLLLSHDGTANAFYCQAHQLEEAELPEPASVSFWFTVNQAEKLADEALQICAAGRPRCFLCGLPINPEGHVCPRSNGHAILETG